MWKEALIWLGGSIISSGILGAVIAWALNRQAKKHDDLKKEVTSLKDEKLVALEKKDTELKAAIDKIDNKLDEHKKDDRSQEILTEIKTIKGLTVQNGTKIDNFSSEQSRQGQAILSNEKYISNLDDSFQKHKAREKH